MINVYVKVDLRLSIKKFKFPLDVLRSVASCISGRNRAHLPFGKCARLFAELYNDVSAL